LQNEPNPENEHLIPTLPPLTNSVTIRLNTHDVNAAGASRTEQTRITVLRYPRQESYGLTGGLSAVQLPASPHEMMNVHDENGARGVK